jgi:hypothetical protein
MMASVAPDAVDWLDKHDGSAVAVLTLLLVLTTIYYAWQNRRMVKEMEAARRLTLLPKLALKIHTDRSGTLTSRYPQYRSGNSTRRPNTDCCSGKGTHGDFTGIRVEEAVAQSGRRERFPRPAETGHH